jgi:hypothetical protein
MPALDNPAPVLRENQCEFIPSFQLTVDLTISLIEVDWSDFRTLSISPIDRYIFSFYDHNHINLDLFMS